MLRRSKSKSPLKQTINFGSSLETGGGGSSKSPRFRVKDEIDWGKGPGGGKEGEGRTYVVGMRQRPRVKGEGEPL